MTTLEWRALRAEDSAAWVDLSDAVEEVDKTGEHMGAEEFAEVMSDPDLVTVAGFDGDQMVASGISWFKAGHVEVNSVLFEAGVRPSHRRRGIGRELLDRLTAVARSQHDQRCPDLRFEPRSTAHEANEGHAALLTGAGYEPVRYFFDMRVDLAIDRPDRALPDGLTARTFEPADDEHLRVVHNACFAGHWGSIPSQPEYWHRHMTGNPSFRPEHTVLLFDQDDKIVAYVMGYASPAQEAGTGRKELWLGQVGTVKPWRGKGVGTALLASVLTGAKVAGFDRAALAVDSGNATGALGGLRAVRVQGHRPLDHVFAHPLGDPTQNSLPSGSARTDHVRPGTLCSARTVAPRPTSRSTSACRSSVWKSRWARFLPERTSGTFCRPRYGASPGLAPLGARNTNTPMMSVPIS